MTAPILAAAAIAIIGATFVIGAFRLAGDADDAQPTIEELLDAEALRIVAAHFSTRKD